VAERFEDEKIRGDKRNNSGTSGRRYHMLFCIMAAYIMPKCVKRLKYQKECKRKLSNKYVGSWKWERLKIWKECLKADSLSFDTIH